MRRKPLVIICSDSWIQYQRGDGITAGERRSETKRATKIFEAEVDFLGIPDSELEGKKLINALVGYRPDKVYAPLPNSKNEQHSLVGKVAYDLWPDNLVYYSTYTQDSLEPKGEIEIVPTAEEIELKNKALDCYKSQIRINNQHFLAVRGKSEFLNLANYKNVSAVLLSQKRQKEPEEIKKHIETIPFIDEVIVWANSPEDSKKAYGRYLGARNAKNDVIYVQDDDCIVENIPEIYSTFDGKRLSNGIMLTRMKDYVNQQGDEHILH